MSFQNTLRPFFPFFCVALFLGGRKLLLNWVCCLLVHSSSMITRDLSTGEGRDLLSLRSVWLFSSYLLLWVSHSPLGRGENCLHLWNLFIKQKFSQEKRETEREKKGVFFHWNIMSKDFCVKFLKHFTAIMLTACTVYGSGSQLFTANSTDCLIWIKSMLARILKSQATKLSCKTFSNIIDGRTARRVLWANLWRLETMTTKNSSRTMVSEASAKWDRSDPPRPGESMRIMGLSCDFQTKASVGQMCV